MNPQPKQLALLISLIGVGVSPGAWARSELRVMGVAPSSQDLVALDSVDANSLVDHAALSVDPLELPPSSALETIGASPGWLLYAAPDSDDWAPGESPDGLGDRLAREWVEPATPAVDSAATTTSDASPPQLQPNRPHFGKTRRVRVLVRAPGPTPARIDVLATTDDRAIERIAPVLVVPQQAMVPDVPSHAERLLESLADVLREAPALERVANQEPAAFVDVALPPAAPDVARVHEPSAARLERAEIVVDTESNKVLGILGAILSGERDEVGAIKLDAEKLVVTSQSEKVMTMLGEISSAGQPQEDGPARRARKLAARAALRAEAERPKSVEPELAQDLAAMPPLTVPVAPPQTEGRMRSTPFGDRQVAVSEKLLDGVRGGFGVDGLNISFGIERAVYINGALVTTTSLNLSDLGRITAGSGATAINAGTIALIQSGAGNLVSAGTFASGAVGTVIQNTLDGQKIQNMTVINATTNSLGALRGLNLESSMRGAVIDSLRR